MSNQLIFKNENGTATLTSALLSFFILALIVGFGETVSACYQMVTLQHAVNEGLRAGIIGDEANANLGRGDKFQAAGDVTTNVAEMLINGSSNDFVAGSTLTVTPENQPDSKWLVVTAKKHLSFGVFGNLVLGLSDGEKGFSLSLTRLGKIEAK